MADNAGILTRYLRLRKVGRALNDTLVSRLPKDVLDEGGNKLGILKRGILVFDSEAEMPVLMDYCLHDIRRQGRTAIEDYLAEAPFPPDSDEMVYLRALKAAIYSLFLVESVEPGIGVHVRDLMRNDTRFIADVGFSHTAVPGLVLASRVCTLENFSMSTGAALPVGMVGDKDKATWLARMVEAFKAQDFANMTREEASEVATRIIRGCLKHGAMSQVVYQDPRPGSDPLRGRLPPARTGRISRPATPGRVGRNDPCPCGSGQKFKKCHGARR